MRTWADDFNTYEEACIYYGADTPASLAAEERFYAALEREEAMDAMEARGGPAYRFDLTDPWNDLPF